MPPPCPRAGSSRDPAHAKPSVDWEPLAFGPMLSPMPARSVALLTDRQPLEKLSDFVDWKLIAKYRFTGGAFVNNGSVTGPGN